MGDNRENGLAGKRVVLLGGTSGIGLATALAVANEGASVVVVSSGQQKVDEAGKAMRKSLPKLTYI